MSDTGNTTPPAGTTPAAPAPAAAPTTPTAPATADDQGGERVYRNQEQFDQAFGARLEREKAKLAATREAEIKAARDEATAEVTTSFQSRLVETETKAIATALKFHDPADALATIDKTKLPVDKDGNPDSKAIKEALEALAKAKPYLVATDESPKARPTSSKPKLPEGNADPDAGQPRMKAAEALRALASKGVH